MVEPITRRRVVRGAGAVGIVGLLGTTVATAQETETDGADRAALRVAHTSPDAPAVDVRQAEIAPQGQTVYSGFAVGYFDPEAATAEDQEQARANDTDDTDVGVGNGTGGGDELAETGEPEAFEFVTVEDASGGDRSDGGTGGFL